QHVLVDSAYATKEGVTAVESAGTKVVVDDSPLRAIEATRQRPARSSAGRHGRVRGVSSAAGQGGVPTDVQTAAVGRRVCQCGLPQPEPATVSSPRIAEGESGRLVACVG